MSEEKFEYVDKLSVDLTIAKASIELSQRVDVLLKILEQERAHGYSEGLAAVALDRRALDQRKWVKLTEEEIGELYRMGWKNNMDFARAIEFALEKKNGAHDELRECVKEFFQKYLNIREESDSGRMFAPVQVSSVRSMLVEPLGELLEKMRALSGAERPTPYNPDDY